MRLTRMGTFCLEASTNDIGLRPVQVSPDPQCAAAQAHSTGSHSTSLISPSRMRSRLGSSSERGCHGTLPRTAFWARASTTKSATKSMSWAAPSVSAHCRFCRWGTHLRSFYVGSSLPSLSEARRADVPVPAPAPALATACLFTDSVAGSSKTLVDVPAAAAFAASSFCARASTFAAR